jgi:protein O-GlcNAc transferase
MKTPMARPDTAGAGRNSPCPCGSGRKYKHCCARGSLADHGTSAAHCYERGNELLGRGEHALAVAQFREAVTLEPAFYQAYSNLGLALEACGLRAEAFDSYAAAVQHSAGTPEATGTLVNYLICLRSQQRELFQMLRSDLRAADEVLAQHLALGRKLAAHTRHARRGHGNGRDPARRLRIGYLSPDFRLHSVAYFIAPVIAAHDRSQVEVFCYHSCPLSDGVSKRIAHQADHWTPCADWSDERLAARIREDGIDILVDLAGHTVGNRILTLALKPAPIQIAYLGYPHATGLEAMDYLLSDPAAAGAALPSRAEAGERALIIEPSMLLYQPAFGPGGLLQAEGPAVTPPPMLANGFATFGCFNDASKISERAISLWAQVLAASPTARLLLKSRSLGEAAARTTMLGRFARHQVQPERLRLEGRIEDPASHLLRYNEVDVALDTLPYNGVTTSLEAMWMGVPVVTLAGTTLAGRMGVTIATNAGHPEWIAASPQAYVAQAVALTRDPQQLMQLRSGLRQELASSALLDAARFTRALERAYRDAWRRWCSA